jgi:hypothetical protein
MVLFDEKKPEVQKSRGTVPHVRGTVLLNRATIFIPYQGHQTTFFYFQVMFFQVSTTLDVSIISFL